MHGLEVLVMLSQKRTAKRGARAEQQLHRLTQWPNDIMLGRPHDASHVPR